MDKIEKRKNLDEVSFIRPILIILLVAYHAFAPWCGAWVHFDGFHDNKCYWWLGKVAYSFMLPTFVFISGYVWSYQRETLQRKLELKALFIQKLKRLYVPSLLFSILYVITIDGIEGGGSMINYIYIILQGRAHMWFLPMLLWCFAACYLLLKIEKKWLRWLIIVVLLICSRSSLPFQISSSAYYLLYFYLGYDLYRYSDKIRCNATNIAVFISWIGFVVIFIMATVGIEYLHQFEYGYNMFYRILVSVSSLFLSVSYSVLGVCAILLSSYHYTQHHELSRLYIKIGDYCFGVYLIQQFILQLLYYKLPISCTVNNIWLPWLGLVLTLVTSLLLSYLIKLSNIGKKII